jgi:2,3-dihydroxy-p-cumate/2,3-dihydroxybenzoate 3,4-dioxygenase
MPHHESRGLLDFSVRKRSTNKKGMKMSNFISDLSYVSLAVPDFETERAFFGGPWGLQETAGNSKQAFFASHSGRENHLIRLRHGEDRRMDAVGFTAPDRQAVDRLACELASRDIHVITAPHDLSTPGGGYGLIFFDNDGRTVEVSAEVAPRARVEPTILKGVPIGISHVVFFTPDVHKTVEFYTQVLGFKVSDWLDEFMVFLRCNHKHHCIAFMKGPASLNHVAFDMVDADDMMRGMGRALSAGVKLNWGPGRHTAGDNTFSYFVSPAGNVVEYTAELETIDDATWEAHVYPRSFDIIDQWGTSKLAGPVEHGVATPDPGLWQAGALYSDPGR